MRALALAALATLAALAAPALAAAGDDEPPVVVSDRPLPGALYNGAKPAFVWGHGPALIVGKPDAAFPWDAVYPVDAYAVDGDAGAAGVARVEFRRNGALVAVDEEPPFSYDWSLATAAAGWYDFHVTAFDHAGNSAEDEVRALVLSTSPATATQGPSAFVGEDPLSGMHGP